MNTGCILFVVDDWHRYTVLAFNSHNINEFRIISFAVDTFCYKKMPHVVENFSR